jgi:hypothetical protein
MALNTVSSVSIDSGSELGFLKDQNILTLAGGAVAVMTAGGAAFVATAMAPSYVIGGSLAAGTLLTGGHLKKTTGSYLPFLGNKEDDVTPAPLTAVPTA